MTNPILPFRCEQQFINTSPKNVDNSYSWNISQTDDFNNTLAPAVRLATLRLKVNVYITQQVTLAASVEDNYNNLIAVNRHACFGDVSVKWEQKRIDFELQLNNIFDQRQNTRVSYSGLDLCIHI